MSNDERIAVLETTINHIDGSLSEIKNEIRSVGDKLNNHIEKLDDKVDRVNDRLWANFKWTIAGFASVLALVAHAVHWF